MKILGFIGEKLGGHSTVFPLIVLFLGIPASFMVYQAVQNSMSRVAQLQFEREASIANSALEHRLNSYSHVLFSIRALFESESPVQRDRFHRFVRSLDVQRRYPGFAAINFAAYVTDKDKERFESSVRADTSLNPKGYPGFSIRPAGRRPEYFVIVFIEWMADSDFAFGLDLAASPLVDNPQKVALALHAGRDSGHLMSSAQKLRIQRERDAIYLAMRLAVYKPGMRLDTVDERRAAYLGSVGAAFDIESLVEATMNTESLRGIRCRLFDVSSISQETSAAEGIKKTLLFDTKKSQDSSGDAQLKNGAENVLVYTNRIAVAGRNWELEYSAPREAVLSSLDKTLAPLALGAGLLTTLLLFGIVYTLTSARRRAMSIAADITRDLRDSEQGMAQAQRIAQMGSWALDPLAWTMSWSDETYRLFGLGPATMPRTYAEYLQRIYPEDRGAVDTKLRHALTANEDVSVEHRIVLPDASVRWVLTSARPTARNRLGHMPGIMIDTSDRKRAEGELKQSHEQLQYLSWQLVEAQEVERRRIATELHDVVGQNLTALSINLHIVQAQVANMKNAVAERRIADSATLLQSTTQAIEGVMSDLRPPMLDDYGLLPALQWYATQYSERNSIEVKTSGEESMPRLAPAAELALFRVVQEALNNVAKHAKASKVEIQVERDESQLILSVTDDGQGMAPAPPVMPPTRRRRPGLGMITMRERIQTFGGTVVVQKAAGGGTRVEFRIPF